MAKYNGWDEIEQDRLAELDLFYLADMDMVWDYWWGCPPDVKSQYWLWEENYLNLASIESPSLEAI